MSKKALIILSFIFLSYYLVVCVRGAGEMVLGWPPWTYDYDIVDPDFPRAVAVDSGNNIIVGGFSRNPSVPEDVDSRWRIAKFTASGTKPGVWGVDYTYNPDTHRDEINDIAVDKSDDSIIAVGFEDPPPQTDLPYWRIMKIDSDKNLLWQRTIDFPPVSGDNFQDFANGVAVQQTPTYQGHIIVVGSDHQEGPDNGRWRVVKLDPLDGHTIWSYPFDPNPLKIDYAYDVAVDSNDNIIIVGSDQKNTNNLDWGLMKLNPDGDTIICEKKVVLSSDNEEPFGVAVDSQDNIIVVGYDRQLGIDNSQWRIIKFNPDCSIDLQWARDWTTEHDRASDVAVDEYDNIIVVGTQRGGDDIWRILRLDKYMIDRYTDTVNPLVHVNSYESAKGVAVVEGKNIVVVGSDDAGVPEDYNRQWRVMKFECTPEVCNDGIDNDCDNLVDCEDHSDCDGQAGPGGPECCSDVNLHCVDDDCKEEFCTNDQCEYINRPAGDITECTQCFACNVAGGDCLGITADNGKDCNDDCSHCVAGSVPPCVPWGENDNREVTQQCYYCDGTNLVSQKYTGPEGVDCNDDCTHCLTGICNNRGQCAYYECVLPDTFCDAVGGDCKGYEENSAVCVNCGTYHWTGTGGNLNCCGNDALEDNPYQSAESQYGDPECSDGNDNDCDGNTDDADDGCYQCNPGQTQYCTGHPNGVCNGVEQTCDVNGNWGPCNYPATYEANQEVTCDGLDNDCDGRIDEEIYDPCGSGDCAGGVKQCIEDGTGEWNDCNTKDNDCGLCCICDADGNPSPNLNEDDECAACQECGSSYNCVNSATDASGKCTGCCDDDADGTCYDLGSLETGKDCYKCTVEDIWSLDDASCLGDCDICGGRDIGCSPDSPDPCGSCNVCTDQGSVANCVAQSGETGRDCTADCYDCVIQTGVGVCKAMSEDNDGDCDDICDYCDQGTCKPRNENDNYEVTQTCYYCDGVQITQQPYSGETGFNCNDDCYDCVIVGPTAECQATNDDNDGPGCDEKCTHCVNGVCTDRGQCDYDECDPGDYCDNGGGDCVDPNVNTQSGENVCENCVSGAEHNFGEGWPFEPGATEYCCDNDANEKYVSTVINTVTYEACCELATANCVDETGTCRYEYGGETTCSDGNDNDCDGLEDCDDPDCIGRTGPGGYICCVDVSVCGDDDCWVESCGANNECEAYARDAGDDTECTQCFECNVAGGDCLGITADNGKDCNDDCSHCVAGSVPPCVPWGENDNREVTQQCYYCDGTNLVSQPDTGPEGKDCNDECTWCNAGSCDDRNQCDEDECLVAGQYCHLAGAAGDCKGKEDDTAVCELCGTPYTWTGTGGNLNCCGNDALEDDPYQLSEGPAESPECSDGNDNDCDGYTDDADSGCYSCNPGVDTAPCSNQYGVCSGSYETCNALGQWDGCDDAIYSAWATSQGNIYETPDETLCDGDDNDCDDTTDENIPQSCGSGDCAGTRYCIEGGTGNWENCDTWGIDCPNNVCCKCNLGTASEPAENADLTQHARCGFCEECIANNLCGYQTDTDLKGECTGNCDECNGEGACRDDVSYCSGNCPQCAGSGTHFDCQPKEDICESLYKCADCTGGETSWSCTYNPDDPDENTDCPRVICDDGCQIDDANEYTYDYAVDPFNECVDLDTCLDPTCNYNYACADFDVNDLVFKWPTDESGIVRTCGAECDAGDTHSDCAVTNCLSDCSDGSTPPCYGLSCQCGDDCNCGHCYFCEEGYGGDPSNVCKLEQGEWDLTLKYDQEWLHFTCAAPDEWDNDAHIWLYSPSNGGNTPSDFELCYRNPNPEPPIDQRNQLPNECPHITIDDEYICVQPDDEIIIPTPEELKYWVLIRDGTPDGNPIDYTIRLYCTVGTGQGEDKSSCTDLDGGMQPLSPASVSGDDRYGNSYVYYDQCIDANQLKERECDVKNPASTIVNCKTEYGSDYYCTAGRCYKSGGGGCPYLKVWDGQEFVTLEKLGIHEEEGVDAEVQTAFTMKPIQDGKYKMILKEASYLSLDDDGSNIDYVKLTTQDGQECKLLSAIHEKEGDVVSEIKDSDDVRIRTEPDEEIVLEYECYGNEFVFTIEGHNPRHPYLKLASGYINNLINAVKGLLGLNY